MINGFKEVGLFLWSVVVTLGYLTGIPLLKILWKWAFSSKKSIHGDAHWASAKEMKKAGLYSGEGIIVGKVGKRFLRLPKTAHVLNLGRTGSGKTRGYMVPNIRQLKHYSMFVVDPKGGELVALTAEQRKRDGSVVRVINPLDGAKSDKFNVLDFVKQADVYERGAAITLVSTLVIPTGRAGTVEEHFTTFAQKLISGLIAFRLSTEMGTVTLPEVLRDLTSRGEDFRKKLFRQMALVEDDPIVSAAVQAFNTASDKEKGSLGTTMANRCLPFLDAGVKETLSESTFHWSGVLAADTPTVVYLNFPIEMEKTYGPYVRLMVGVCVAEIQRRVRKNGGKPLKRPFSVMVDEAAAMGYCESVERGVTYLRGANAQISLAFQSPSQMNAIYKDAQTLQNSCEAWLISGGERNKSIRDELSEIIGDTTIKTASKSKGNYGDSEAESEAPRRLLKPSELRLIPDEEQVVIYKSLNIRCKKPFDFT